MNIDNTELLKALKKEQPTEPTDAEKIEAYPPKVEDLSREAGAMRGANELHDWLTGKEQGK